MNWIRFLLIRLSLQLWIYILRNLTQTDLLLPCAIIEIQSVNNTVQSPCNCICLSTNPHLAISPKQVLFVHLSVKLHSSNYSLFLPGTATSICKVSGVWIPSRHAYPELPILWTANSSRYIKPAASLRPAMDQPTYTNCYGDISLTFTTNWFG